MVVEGKDTLLRKLYLRDRRNTPPAHGWTYYREDLSAFTAGNQCVKVKFNAMNKPGSGVVTQYIDRVHISSEVDIAVSEIIITPNLDVCDMTNKDVKVVIKTTTGQSIDFGKDTTTVVLDIKGTTYTFPLRSRMLKGNTSDTLTLASGVTIPMGVYAIQASLSRPIDPISANDKATYNVNIDPKLELEVLPWTTSSPNCFTPSNWVTPKVKVKNTGTVALSNILLYLEIDEPYANPPHTTLLDDTIVGPIAPGAEIEYHFNKQYDVPRISLYYVAVTAKLGCNLGLLSVADDAIECVELEDIEVTNLINPDPGTKDKPGNAINIEVRINNHGDNTYSNVPVTAEIHGSQGIITTLKTTESFAASENKIVKFSENYIVPNENYSIKIYIENQDNNPINDTLEVPRELIDPPSIKDLDKLGIRLEQNIPNPANNSTLIKYSIPNDGDVTFAIYSISGQVLYNKTEKNVPSGNNQIEVNTEHFAAGIYFYSMEYKGERIVKRMSIKR